jgi:hypothetical protein
LKCNGQNLKIANTKLGKTLHDLVKMKKVDIPETNKLNPNSSIEKFMIRSLIVWV